MDKKAFDTLVGSLAEKLYAHTRADVHDYEEVIRQQLTDANILALEPVQTEDGDDIVESLATMSLMVMSMARRVRYEADRVTLDTCPLHRMATNELHNACIALHSAINWKHEQLLKQTYNGKTLGDAIKDRIEKIYAHRGAVANVEPEQVKMTHAEILQAIDQTP